MKRAHSTVFNLLSMFLICLSASSQISCSNSQQNSSSDESCSLSEIESEMENKLSAFSTDTDFTYLISKIDSKEFSYSNGSVSESTLLESASTSKLVTAVIILRLVDAGYLSLDSKPQDFISSWPLSSSSPLYQMKLRHLLAFTSGLKDEPACVNLAAGNFENCVNTIATTNSSHTTTPGSEFYYASTHLQVAGLMAIKARGVSNWQSVFTEFKSQTGLFADSSYDLPSSSNPRLAGGMHWTGRNYFEFLKKLKSGDLLNTSTQTFLETPQNTSSTIAYSPASVINEDWRYGAGSWHECASTTFNCSGSLRISSPGAYGAYPFWDRENNFVGLVVRQGNLGTFPKGIEVDKEVRSLSQMWANCQ